MPLSKTASLRRNYRHLGDGKAATATLFVPTIEPPKQTQGRQEAPLRTGAGEFGGTHLSHFAPEC